MDLNKYIDLLEKSVTIQRILQKKMSNFSNQFELDHYNYCLWLRTQLESAIREKEYNDIFRSLGIDWITLNYMTRHRIDDYNTESEWLQLGNPIEGGGLESYKDKAQVYIKDRIPFGMKPPYFYIHELSRNKTYISFIFESEKKVLALAHDNHIFIFFSVDPVQPELCLKPVHLFSFLRTAYYEK